MGRFLGALAVAVSAVVALVAVPAVADAATGTIVGIGGKCADVSGASSADGTAVVLYTCNGTSAQSWSRPGDGTVRALGKCLDVVDRGTGDGAKLQLWTCTGAANQQWSYSAGHDLVNPVANRCMDASGTADGSRLQIWTCTGASNQKWTVPAASTTPPPSGSAPMAVAPYLYEGWGNPPDPAVVSAASGVRWYTMAFMLSQGTCNPAWDSSRPVAGGVDASVISGIRARGGDVVVSFGGASGTKLGRSCSSASALAAAYQKVIDALSLKAVDVDIETDEFGDATLRQREVDALKIVATRNPGIALYFTFPINPGGPDGNGVDLVHRAATAGLQITAWTSMPFDFGGGSTTMAGLTIAATDALAATVASAYGYSSDTAYRHVGISSMNGLTDDPGEKVSPADFATMLDYASTHHLGRLTFWSVNRDRPCTGGASTADDTCNGVSQQAWQYTSVFGRYRG